VVWAEGASLNFSLVFSSLGGTVVELRGVEPLTS
jgi:hypothetical protein